MSERGHNGLELSDCIDRSNEEDDRIEKIYKEFVGLDWESTSDQKITTERLYQIFEQTPEIVEHMSPISASYYAMILAHHLDDVTKADVFRNTYAKAVQNYLIQTDAKESRIALDLLRDFLNEEGETTE
ncbi:MAG: hypothetical protein AABX48_03525 [Nanoarchaeota archaeon]